MKLLRYLSLKKADLFVGVLAFLAVVLIIAGSRISRLANSNAIYSEEPVDIYLSEPVNLKELSRILADSGVVKSVEEVIWAGRLLGWRNFNPGYYQIEGGYSYNVLLSRMARGIQDPIRVTVLPGLNKQSLIRNLSQQLQVDSLALAEVLNDSAFLAEAGLNEKSIIGRMLPETYSLYWTASAETVIKRILDEFNSAVYEPYKDRFEEIDITVNEIVTLASIIEWEATMEDEKKKVSGLYWNRLERGMLLQADPTVNFAVKERRRLLFEDYRIQHPYNTYIHKGLPPGPITNPSLSSIEAALFPEDHDYLFMVASPNGYHVFSRTFAEHKEESAKWRRWLQEQYRIKREQEVAEEKGVSR